MVIDSSDLLLIFGLLVIFIVNSNLNKRAINIRDIGREDKGKRDIDQNIYIVREKESGIIEPKRYYDSKYHTRQDMAINIPTRGEPPPYQQVGYLGDTSDPENVKPLYGRQTYRGSNQWNYFTSLDSHLATKIPLEIQGNDCTDDKGCTELQKNANVNVNGKTYQTKIYQTHAPRYVPY